MAENVEQAVNRLRGVLDSLAAAGPVIVHHDSLFAADLLALIAAYADAARDRELVGVGDVENLRHVGRSPACGPQRGGALLDLADRLEKLL